MPTKPALFILFAFSLTFAALASSASAAAPTTIYRSVGPALNTALTASGGVNQLTVSGTQATFNSNLVNYIGVGDVLIYDSNNDGTQDAAAFIHGRIDARTFTVYTSSGGTPPATGVPDLDWEIYFAYLSLYDAERGAENTGIPAPLRNFDTWSGGKNIVSSDEIWIVACYGTPQVDSQPVQFDGWTTGPSNYIQIYTPYLTTEVGVSQRHNGTWDTSAYRMEISNDTALDLNQSYVRVAGLQIRILSVNSDETAGIWMEGPGSSGDVRVSHTIIRGVWNTSYAWHTGFVVFTAGSGVVRLWNNLIYDFNGNSQTEAIDIDDPEYTAYLYNNTLQNCYYGIYSWNGTVVAKNTITQNCNNGFAGPFHSASDYNLSDLPGDAPGTNSKNSTTVSFVNAGADDFHLAVSDTAARDSGTDLSGDADLPFSNDIDIETRSGTWDIGADEEQSGATPTFTPTVTSTVTQGDTPTFTPTRTITPTPTVTSTATPQYSATHTPTRTATPTQTLSRTATSTATITETNTTGPTATLTRTPTASPTLTQTPVLSPTDTPTSTYSATPSRTRTITQTRTHTPSPTISQTRTISPTITVTFTPTPSLTISITSTEVPLVVEDILAYPQPATGNTAYFYYKLDQPAQIEIEVFNVLGEQVATLRESKPGVGYERTAWDIRNAAPGVYMYRLKIKTSSSTTVTSIKKLVIVVLRR